MRLLAAALALFLLAGCAQQEPAMPEPTQAQTLHVPGHALEQQTKGIIEVFPTQERGDCRLLSFGNSLLLCSGSSITLYHGRSLRQDPTALSGIPVFLGEDALWLWESEGNSLLLLDRALTETGAIPLPADALGLPGVSPEGTALYYLKADGLYVQELSTGITRVLRDNMAVDTGSIQALSDGLTLLVRLTDPNGAENTLLISTQDGSALYEALRPGDAAWCKTSLGLLSRENGFQKLLVTGESGEIWQLLVGAEERFVCFLPEIDALVTSQATEDAGITANLYNLSTGLRKSTVTLPGIQALGAGCVTGDGSIYLSARSQEGSWWILRWNYDAFPPEDLSSLLVPFTQDTPDQSQARACRAAAQALSDACGIRVRVLEDAAQVEPWDYSLTPSTRTDETLWALQTAQTILSSFPEGFLSQLQEGYGSLSLCFVDSICGSPQSGSLLRAKGLQFEEDQDSFLVLALAPAQELRYSLVHELSHLIDSQVIRFSSAYDNWSDLNPQEFSYSLDVNADMGRFRSFLEGTGRCFVDEYAMTYPTEDRARILEYAMNPGNEALFVPPVMQQKLRRICTGIREGFGLTDAEETFLWEQYLVQYRSGS